MKKPAIWIVMRELKSNKPLTKLLANRGVLSLEDLMAHLRTLPYGRNASRSDFSLVLSEGQGTCSSKHALIKEVADENQIKDITLMLVLYKMTPLNTPGIGSIGDLSFIPEAHCFIYDNDVPVDVTSSSADFERIKSSIIFEREIQPNEVSEFKVQFHRNFISNWLKEKDLPMSMEDVWSIRENCITNLAGS